MTPQEQAAEAVVTIIETAIPSLAGTTEMTHRAHERVRDLPDDVVYVGVMPNGHRREREARAFVQKYPRVTIAIMARMPEQAAASDVEAFNALAQQIVDAVDPDVPDIISVTDGTLRVESPVEFIEADKRRFFQQDDIYSGTYVAFIDMEFRLFP